MMIGGLVNVDWIIPFLALLEESTLNLWSQVVVLHHGVGIETVFTRTSECRTLRWFVPQVRYSLYS